MYNTQFFIMGLREEILARLQTTKFETLVATSKAAKEAKDYLKSVASLKTHHVRVHAMNQRSSGSGKDRGRSFSRESKKGSECNSCGKEGHWSRECPKEDRSDRTRSQSRGRSSSRTRFEDKPAALIT